METFSCSTCAKSFTGVVPFQQHLDSIKHKKKIEQGAVPKTELFCDTCNKSFNGPLPFKEHMVSPAHKKELMKREAVARSIGNNLMNSSNSCLSSEKDVIHSKNHTSNSIGSHALDEQPVPVPTSFSRILNFRGNPHFSNENGTLSCLLCEVNFTGPESAASHFSGSKHLKNITKQQVKIKLQSSEINCGTLFANNLKNDIVQENYFSDTKQIQHPKYNNILNGKAFYNELNKTDCQVCGIESFNATDDMIKHFESEEHRNEIKSRSPPGGKLCSYNTSFNNEHSSNDGTDDEEDYYSCDEVSDETDSANYSSIGYMPHEAFANCSPIKIIENKMKIFDCDEPFCLDLN